MLFQAKKTTIKTNELSLYFIMKASTSICKQYCIMNSSKLQQKKEMLMISEKTLDKVLNKIPTEPKSSVSL